MPSYTVNLNLAMGVDFSQEFFLTNPDKSPLDITGCKFSGAISKWSGSYNAVDSTSDAYVYNSVPLTGTVSSGTGGAYTLSVEGKSTLNMEEGKYVYSVVMEDVNGTTSKVLDGLVFVDYCIK